MRAYFLFILATVLWEATLAQCPIVDFQLPSMACRGQSLYLENTTQEAQAHIWDMCSGDLQLVPTTNFVVAGSTFFRARVFRMVQAQNGLWYGFAIDQPNNLLVRFDFGDNPDNTPSVTSLGNPASKFQNPSDIHFISENNNWFALVANTAGNNLLRLNFGNDLTSTPSVNDLGSFSGTLQAPGGIYTVVENGNLFAFVSNGSSSQITSFSFGNSVLNSPTPSIIPVSGSSGLRGLAFIRECDQWIGLVTSYNTGSLYQLVFQNGLNQPPVVNPLTIPGSSYSFPASVKLVNEGGEFFAFVQSAFPAHVYRIAFGESITDLSGTFTNLGNFGISNDNSAFELVGYNSEWRGFSIDLSGTIPGAGRLFRFNFPEACSASIRTFEGINPPAFTFTNEGIYRVALRSIDASGNSGYKSKTITVGSAASPDIDINKQNLCSSHPIDFTSINISANISSYQWNFGDFNSSTQQNPSHTYASPGLYNVQLNVVGSNGCSNTIRKTVEIFNEPLADFEIPISSPICTNQQYQFNNTTQFDSGINPSWEWSVNGVVVSTNFILESLFNNPTSQTVKLVASIPGCVNEVEKLISSVSEGPLVDFSFVGQCQSAPIVFTNQSSGSILNYSWDFGDGQNSTDTNPRINFGSSGFYEVTLTALGSAGCSNTTSKPITIYSNPQPNFSLDLPPFSCAGSLSQFNDLTPALTDSNITSWSWRFGDAANGTSAQKNPTYIYNLATEYDVSLQVTSNFGCSSSIEKTITISPSPVAEFANGPTCINKPTQFTDVSGSEVKAWLWSVNNSSYTTKNPTHTFSTTGTQSVMLTVTANNNCVNQTTKTMVVPVPVVADFTSASTCAGTTTIFQEINSGGIDPAVAWNWNFAGQANASTSSAQHIFPNTGNFPVTLTSTRQSGCSYSLTKSILIVQPPSASFTVSTESGAAPLAVGFTNTSTLATSFLWKFNDPNNSTSTDFSPAFVFNQLGSYQVELIASNAAGCSDNFTEAIQVVVPEINAVLSDFILSSTPDGGKKATVTIENKSNITLVNPEVYIDLSGNALIREKLSGTILPGQSITRMLTVDIIPRDLTYACAEVKVLGDSFQFDNRACLNLTSEPTYLQPYPNPAQSQLFLDWINESQESLQAVIYNSSGQIAMNRKYNLLPGLNQVLVDVNDLATGIYFVSYSDGRIIRSFRFSVAR